MSLCFSSSSEASSPSSLGHHRWRHPAGSDCLHTSHVSACQFSSDTAATLAWTSSFLASTFHQVQCHIWSWWWGVHHWQSLWVSIVPAIALQWRNYWVCYIIIVPHHSLTECTLLDSLLQNIFCCRKFLRLCVLFLEKPPVQVTNIRDLCFGTYSEQTNCSAASYAMSDRCWDVSMLASPYNVSSEASLNAFQHDTLPFPEELPVTSVPLSTWKAGKAAAFCLPVQRRWVQV